MARTGASSETLPLTTVQLIVFGVEEGRLLVRLRRLSVALFGHLRVVPFVALSQVPIVQPQSTERSEYQDITGSTLSHPAYADACALGYTKKEST